MHGETRVIACIISDGSLGHVDGESSLPFKAIPRCRTTILTDSTNVDLDLAGEVIESNWDTVTDK